MSLIEMNTLKNLYFHFKDYMLKNTQINYESVRDEFLGLNKLSNKNI